MKNGSAYSVSLGSFGPGFMHAWRWSLVYGGVVVPFSSMSSNADFITPLCWSAFLFACFLLLAAVSRKMAERKFGYRITGFTSVLGSIGTALVVIAFRQQAVNPLAVTVAGIALSAIAMSFLTVSWSELFSRMGFEQVRTSTALFISFGTGVFLVCERLPEELCLIITAAFPIASFILLRTKDMETPFVAPESSDTMQTGPFAAFAVCLVCFSAANSFLRGMGISSIGEEETSAGLLFCTIAVTCIAFAFARSPKVLLSTAVLCMAGGMGLLALGNSTLGTTATGSGFVCFEVLVWMTVAETPKRFQSKPLLVASLAWAFLYAGSVAGLLLGKEALLLGGLGQPAGTMMSLLLAYCVIAAFVFNYNRSFLDMFAPAPEEKQPPTMLIERANEFAQCRTLTARETEILLILIQGRTLKHIAKELVISENTVKTHVKNIYRKAEVSSKDELIDKVAATPLGQAES